MSSFTTRVELRGTPSGADYQNLHTAMANKGFKQTIEIGGSAYQLPHAEYDFAGELSVHQVLGIVKNIVASVWTDYLVLVTEVKERAGFLVQIK